MLVILICIFGFPASSCIYYDISLHVMNVVFIFRVYYVDHDIHVSYT